MCRPVADSNKSVVGGGWRSTLDQAMMAVMPFNITTVTGPATRFLLADEIHARDAWMSRILEGLIERQASNGNATILLSATLSQQQRDKLVYFPWREAVCISAVARPDDYPG